MCTDDELINEFENEHLRMGAGSISARVSSGKLDFFLKSYLFKKREMVNVFDAWIKSRLYTANLEFVDERLSQLQVTQPNDDIRLTQLATSYSRPDILDTWILKITVYVRVELNGAIRKVYAFDETISNIGPSYEDWLIGRNKRLGT